MVRNKDFKINLIIIIMVHSHLDGKSVFNENLGGIILGDTQCEMGEEGK
jgi:hypothetical protein